MKPTHRALLTVAIVSVLAASTPSPAQASTGPNYSGLGEAILLGLAGITVELLVPDMSGEYGEGVEGTDLVLAWPIPVSLGAVNLIDTIAVGFNLFIEPQYRPAGDAGRVVFGGRAPVFAVDRSDSYEPNTALGIGFFVEGGGIVGSDGSGFMVGGGPMAGLVFASLGINYRYMEIGGQERQSLTAEVHVALPAFFLWTH